MTNADEMARASILGGQLRAAREGIGLSVAEASEAVEISRDELAEWEAEKAQPTIERLWDLAELYCRGVDYFLRTTPPVPENVSFRVGRASALRDLSLEARKVLARFEELCRAETELERLTNETPVHPLQTVAEPADPEALAKSERVRLNLSDRPIEDLRAVLATQGVRVFELPVPNDEFAGFSWRHAAYGPCVLVNAGDVFGRRRWTLAHEYFHLLASDTPHMCDLRRESVASSEERLAERFAAEFLMPPGAFLSDWQKRAAPRGAAAWEHIAPVASRYRVSLQAAAIRLVQVAAVSQQEIDRLLAHEAPAPVAYGRRRPEFERQLGSRYVTLALDAYSGRRISLGKLAEYLGVTAQSARQAAEARESDGGA